MVKNAKEGIKEMKRKEGLVKQGKTIYTANKPLPEGSDKLTEQGYYAAMRKEQLEKKKIADQKEQIQSLKRQQELETERLKLAKIKNQIKKENKTASSDDGW